MKALFGFLGRIAISIIFVFAAAHKVLNWESTYQQFLDTLSQWQGRMAVFPSFQDFFSYIIPLAPIILLIATIFEGLGGILILLGFQPRAGALLLILFLIPVTVVYHPFWVLEGQEAQLQMIMFLKNLSILGGLLILASSGKGTNTSKAESN